MTPATVVVTGANRGTGAALAESFQARGVRVLSVGRTPHPSRSGEFIECDLRSRSSVCAAVESIGKRIDRLDVFVANAACRDFRSIHDTDFDSWSDSLMVNLSSQVMMISALLPLLRVAGGAVVLMGSHAGSRFFEGGAQYSAAKAALKAVAETLLLEERGHGVRTTLVSPGAISNRDWDDSAHKMTPASVAEIVTYVALDAPPDLCVGEIEIRPARLPPAQERGIVRLQRV